MTEDPDIQIFLEYSEQMMDVNSLFAGWEDNFARTMTNFADESIRESFRRGFAKSLSGQLTPADYEKATRWDFDTAEELEEHLRSLWIRFYGEEEPADYLS